MLCGVVCCLVLCVVWFFMSLYLTGVCVVSCLMLCVVWCCELLDVVFCVVFVLVFYDSRCVVLCCVML